VLFLSLALALALALAWPRTSAAATRIDHEAECTYKRLTWDDFRGPIVTGQQVAWIAATVVMEPVQVEMGDGDDGSAVARARNPVAYALMNKLASGAQRGGRNDRNLAHEQIHFDLAEVIARRFSRELNQLEVRGDTRSEALQRDFLLEIERRYGEALADLERLQAEYDGETANGRRPGAQKNWARRAESLLASEPPYDLR
jgi:hypothetical protein